MEGTMNVVATPSISHLAHVKLTRKARLINNSSNPKIMEASKNTTDPSSVVENQDRVDGNMGAWMQGTGRSFQKGMQKVSGHVHPKAPRRKFKGQASDLERILTRKRAQLKRAQDLKASLMQLETQQSQTQLALEKLKTRLKSVQEQIQATVTDPEYLRSGQIEQLQIKITETELRLIDFNETPVVAQERELHDEDEDNDDDDDDDDDEFREYEANCCQCEDPFQIDRLFACQECGALFCTRCLPLMTEHLSHCPDSRPSAQRSS